MAAIQAETKSTAIATVPQMARKWKRPITRSRPAGIGRSEALGETVQAFGVDGERVGAKAVLKALAEPKGVAVFIGRDPKDPQAPPAFYRSLLREGTIILVVKPADIYNPNP
jgi:hypothetical protein